MVEVGYDQRFVLRVSLPVDPRHKMAGEVATLGWLSQHSTVPVPKVIAFDDTRDNKIGFEWILMDHVSRTSAQTRWRKMTMEDKKTLVENIAHHHAQLLPEIFPPDEDTDDKKVLWHDDLSLPNI